MKYIYMVKYLIQNIFVAALVILGDAPVLNESFYYKTYDYFKQPKDVRKAFELYLANRGIVEKPYFQKNGFQLKSEFMMSVIELSREELTKIYPLSE